MFHQFHFSLQRECVVSDFCKQKNIEQVFWNENGKKDRAKGRSANRLFTNSFYKNNVSSTQFHWLVFVESVLFNLYLPLFSDVFFFVWNFTSAFAKIALNLKKKNNPRNNCEINFQWFFKAHFFWSTFFMQAFDQTMFACFEKHEFWKKIISKKVSNVNFASKQLSNEKKSVTQTLSIDLEHYPLNSPRCKWKKEEKKNLAKNKWE